MLWMGGAVKAPLEVSTYSSQCDLAATLLGQLNIDHSRFSFSKDIFDPASPHYAYWSYNNGFGIISDKGNVVYSCTGDKITSHAGTDAAAESLTRAGKALTQSIHQDICNR